MFMKCDMPEVLIKDNLVLLDVNERARSYSNRTQRFALK